MSLVLSDMTMRLTEIPRVCFEDEEELTETEGGEIQAYKVDFSDKTTLWLTKQRDAEDQEVAIETWKRDFVT